MNPIDKARKLRRSLAVLDTRQLAAAHGAEVTFIRSTSRSGTYYDPDDCYADADMGDIVFDIID